MSDLYADYQRLKRVAKSLIPRFNRRRNRKHYQLADARHMLNELGMQMSPQLLEYLSNDDRKLDEFIDGIYALEDDLDMEVINDFGTIREDLHPKVYSVTDERIIGFSVSHDGDEVIFVEYKIPKNES